MPLGAGVSLNEVSRAELGRDPYVAQLRGTILTVIYVTGDFWSHLVTGQPRVDGQEEGPGTPVTGRPLLSPTGILKIRSDCSTQSQVLLLKNPVFLFAKSG